MVITNIVKILIHTKLFSATMGPSWDFCEYFCD